MIRTFPPSLKCQPGRKNIRSGKNICTAHWATERWPHITHARTMDQPLGAVHILRQHFLGSLDTLGGVVSTWSAFALTLGIYIHWWHNMWMTLKLKQHKKFFNTLHSTIFTYYHLQVDVDILHFLAVLKGIFMDISHFWCQTMWGFKVDFLVYYGFS